MSCGLPLFIQDGDGLDLHQYVRASESRLDRGSAWLVAAREIFGVDFVHGLEVSYVGQEHGALDHVFHHGPALCEDSLDVFHHLIRLGRDVTKTDQISPGIQGYLAGRENEPSLLDTWGVGVFGDSDT